MYIHGVVKYIEDGAVHRIQPYAPRAQAILLLCILNYGFTNSRLVVEKGRQTNQKVQVQTMY